MRLRPEHAPLIPVGSEVVLQLGGFPDIHGTFKSGYWARDRASLPDGGIITLTNPRNTGGTQRGPASAMYSTPAHRIYVDPSVAECVSLAYHLGVIATPHGPDTILVSASQRKFATYHTVHVIRRPDWMFNRTALAWARLAATILILTRARHILNWTAAHLPRKAR